MFLTHLSQITTLVMAAVCAWAALGGGWPERTCAVALAANWIGSAVFEDRRASHHLQPVWFGLDVTLFLVLLVLVLASRRSWCLWACACGLLLVFCHLTVLVDHRLTQWSYITVYYVWSMGLVTALGVGMAVEGRRPAAPLRIAGWPGLGSQTR